MVFKVVIVMHLRLLLWFCLRFRIFLLLLKCLVDNRRKF